MVDFQALIDALNPQQRAAVTTTDGPLLVIAGAGSGKTRVITHRIAYLIHERGVAPWQVFAATFTNKAAEEMRHRIGKLLPGADTARLAISTFHSLCVGILRREAECLGLTSRFTICDDSDQLALIKDCLKQLGPAGAGVKPEEIRNWIATAKILMLEPDQARREMPAEGSAVCAQVYATYQERLLSNDAVDFDDLIWHVVRIFQRHPEVLERYQERWRYLLVDEYQDTNRVQFELVKLLAARYGNICAVGDEDQSIYSWRGAEIENLLKFPDLFPGTQIVRLEENYRSTETILHAASRVIAHNTQRLGKELWSRRGQGEPVTMITGFNERDEAAQIVDTMSWLRRVKGMAYRDMAIFYRVNALSRVFEDQLRQHDIPYRVIGGIKFYDRAEIKDLLAYLRIAVNPRDSIALTRVINKPARGIGEKSMAKIFNDAVNQNVSLWESLQRMAEKDDGTLPRKALAGVRDLLAQMSDWRQLAEDHPAHEILERILRDTQYEESIGGANDLEALSRRENIGELISAIEDFHAADPALTITDFLERVALVNAQDDLSEEDCVSLMSLHCAKGLEYPAVFMTGMEDPIFPSQRAVADQGHFEEERRLFYVGITRARDLLFLSRADSRMFYGKTNYNAPSLFLREVPPELLRTLDDARQAWAGAAAAQAQPAAEKKFREVPREEPGRAKKKNHPTADSAAAAGAEPADNGGLFPIGTRVSHGRLGVGEVVAVSGAGDKRKVSVRFDAGLELEILERYGGLQRIEDDALPF